MPLSFYYGYYSRWQEKKKKDAEKKRRHAEVVRAWKAKEISWNEYVRLEKKYRI